MKPGRPRSIAAGDVVVGDKIFDQQHDFAGARWVSVTGTSRGTCMARLEHGATVERATVTIKTRGWSTMLDVQEGIAVIREEKS